MNLLLILLNNDKMSSLLGIWTARAVWFCLTILGIIESAWDIIRHVEVHNRHGVWGISLADMSRKMRTVGTKGSS